MLRLSLGAAVVALFAVAASAQPIPLPTSARDAWAIRSDGTYNYWFGTLETASNESATLVNTIDAPAGFTPGIFELTENPAEGEPAGAPSDYFMVINSANGNAGVTVDAYFISDGATNLAVSSFIAAAKGAGLTTGSGASLSDLIIAGSAMETGQWQNVSSTFVPAGQEFAYIQSDVPRGFRVSDTCCNYHFARLRASKVRFGSLGPQI